MTTIDRTTALATARTLLASLNLTPQDLLAEPGEGSITFGRAEDLGPILHGFGPRCRARLCRRR
jgi:hypothetical protein